MFCSSNYRKNVLLLHVVVDYNHFDAIGTPALSVHRDSALEVVGDEQLVETLLCLDAGADAGPAGCPTSWMHQNWK